jgi:hypothetical protein
MLPAELAHVIDVEITHAPVANLPRRDELVERLHHGREVFALTPVQQVEIDSLDAQPPQAALARCVDAEFRTRVGRKDFRHEEYSIATSFDGVRHEFFGGAIAVHLGGVDQRETQVDSSLQRTDLLDAPVATVAQLPRALPEYRHPLAR